MYQLQESISQETQGLESLTIHDSKRLYNPYFLKKVLWRESGDYGDIPKLFAVAVHTVLLESGFLGFDPVSGLQTNRFRMREAPPRPFSLCYSLPELLRDDLTDYVVVKFQTLDHFIQVFGFLNKGSGSGIHKLCLDSTHLASLLSDCVTSNDGFLNSNEERQVSEFRKIVKDRLALPLLIDLCYKAGLPLPACFARLPDDLIRKILESLPAPAIARMACVCRELRFLASEEKLWKQKFRQEFGGISERVRIWNWKFLFHSNWVTRKIRIQNQALMGFPRAFHLPMQRDLNPILHPFGVHGHFGLAYVPPNIYLPALQPHPFPPFQVQVQVRGRGRG
ncbi:hypothetical protein V6N13_114944 [Hibiscus sabdariffa]|uniref:F-box domain-containing protein n=2 Tax=Hibiscus sabdariffa TaxID=183260 RepID=A0ABR1ZHN6_9ROSI